MQHQKVVYPKLNDKIELGCYIYRTALEPHPGFPGQYAKGSRVVRFPFQCYETVAEDQSWSMMARNFVWPLMELGDGVYKLNARQDYLEAMIEVVRQRLGEEHAKDLELTSGFYYMVAVAVIGDVEVDLTKTWQADGDEQSQQARQRWFGHTLVRNTIIADMNDTDRSRLIINKNDPLTMNEVYASIGRKFVHEHPNKR